MLHRFTRLLFFGLTFTFHVKALTETLDAWKHLGERYDVKILRDTWGVPHIFGVRDVDTSFGLGYAHCEDDLQHIQDGILLARGMLGSRKGLEGVAVDYIFHLLRIRDLVEERYEMDLSQATRSLCEAYADGITLYCALHPGKVQEELLPVHGKDIVCCFALFTPLFFNLPNVLSDLRKEDPIQISLHLPPGQQAIDVPQDSHLPLGSNVLAVGPRRSADNHTRLAINSHQPWTGPVAWYEAHLCSEEGWDMVGSLFPGSPIILHGHNRDLGWAHTVNNPDLVDIYLLETDDSYPNQYKLDGEWFAFETKEAIIEMGLGEGKSTQVKRECLWSPHHGPVVRTDKGCFAIRYGGMDQIKQIEQWYRMNKAKNLNEFMEALQIRGLSSFNIGYADKDGNLFYLYNAAIPLREEGYNWSGTVPGNTSRTLWKEIVPLDKLPQVLNPEADFFQNCNNTPFRTTLGEDNPNPDDFPDWYGIEDRMTNRALRALELYGTNDSITREEFILYKFDMRYSEQSLAMEVLDQIFSLPKRNKLVKDAIKVIRRWDLSADPENTSAALAILVLEPVVRAQMFGRPAPDLLITLTDKAEILMQAFGKLDVPWMEVNRLIRGDVDLGLGGGPDCLHAIYGKGPGQDGRLTGEAGDSFILIVEWDPNGQVRSQSIHQFGSATMDKNSPHYADQAPLFSQRQLKDVLMDIDQIRTHTQREYRPGQI